MTMFKTLKCSSLLVCIYLNICLSVVDISAADAVCKTKDRGLVTFDADTQLCCNDIVQPNIQNRRKMACCGGDRVYEMDEKVCCGAQLVKKGQVKNTFCCHGDFLEITDQQNDCCMDDKKELDGTPFNNRTQKCCIHETNKSARAIHNIRPGTNLQCCNIQVYDPRIQKCDNNGTHKVVKEKQTSTISTCRYKMHATAYDMRTDICCTDTGVVLELPTFETNSPETEPQYECRKNMVVDTKKIQVIDNLIVSRGVDVCNGVPYAKNPSIYTQLHCCDGHLRLADSSVSGADCCGKLLYDRDQQVCCNDTLLDPGYDCCKKVKYHTGIQGCCRKRGIFNKTTHVCCDWSEIREKLHKNHTACCGNTTFNAYDQVCENNVVYLQSELRKIQKDIVDKLNRYPPKRKLRNKIPCAFDTCGMKGTDTHTDNQTCSKRNGLKIIILDVKNTNNGAKLKAYILTDKRGKTDNRDDKYVTLTTRNQCQCFRNHEVFWLYTNRPIENKTHVRFTGKDFFVHESSSFQCTIDRWARRAKSIP